MSVLFISVFKCVSLICPNSFRPVVGCNRLDIAFNRYQTELFSNSSSDRNAPLEGYIQQFLYTYRYFCTPQELLQFLMGKFTSVAAGYVGYYRRNGNGHKTK